MIYKNKFIIIVLTKDGKRYEEENIGNCELMNLIKNYSARKSINIKLSNGRIKVIEYELIKCICISNKL